MTTFDKFQWKWKAAPALGKRIYLVSSKVSFWSDHRDGLQYCVNPTTVSLQRHQFYICPVTSVQLPLDTLLPIAMATEKRSVFLERAHLLDRVHLFKREVFWCWKGDADRNRKWRDGGLPFRDRNLVGRLIFLRVQCLEPEQSILSKLGKQNQWDETVIVRMRSSFLSSNVTLYYIPSSRVHARLLRAGL